MIPKAGMGIRRYWREALAALAPFIFVLPLLSAITMRWFYAVEWLFVDVLKWPVPVFGFHLVFDLPSLAVSVVAGLVFGIVKTQRPIRLACVFGISMFAAWIGPALFIQILDWRLGLFSLTRAVLPVATTAVWLRLFPVKRPGFCRECDYDLTGNVSGVCPECGTKIEVP